MTNPFFDAPILNSPYAYPARHWELDGQGQPTQRIVESRRNAEFITPIPKPRKQKGAASQDELLFTVAHPAARARAGNVYVNRYRIGSCSAASARPTPGPRPAGRTTWRAFDGSRRSPSPPPPPGTPACSRRRRIGPAVE